MSESYFISDLHLGHERIQNFRSVRDEQDQYELIKDNWHKVIRKRDKVFILGDCCFSMKRLLDLKTWVGEKILIVGNHDLDNLSMVDIIKSEAYSAVYSLFKYKGFWLSHAPIHPDELRGKCNIHGHTHNHVIADDRYLNVCLEHTEYRPMSLTKVRDIFKQRKESNENLS